MIWAGISHDRLTDLAFLLPLVDRICGANYIFQQDNTLIHTSKLTKTFFQERNIKVLSWPASDLNELKMLGISRQDWSTMMEDNFILNWSWKMPSGPPGIWNQTL